VDGAHAGGATVGWRGVSGEYWRRLYAAAENEIEVSGRPVSVDEARRADRQQMWDTWVAKRAAAVREVPDRGDAA
jgi:hypothetical protein